MPEPADLGIPRNHRGGPGCLHYAKAIKWATPWEPHFEVFRPLSCFIGRSTRAGFHCGIVVERALPIIEETAQTLKLLTTGRRDASKDSRGA